MKKIPILAALEKRIRAGENVTVELIALLDAPKKVKPAGLSYKDLLSLFRAELGDMLALPPNPQTGWIVRQVNKAQEYGIVDAETVKLVCAGARKAYPRPPYDLEFLLRNATKFTHPAGPFGGDARVARPQVVVGRKRPDDEQYE